LKHPESAEWMEFLYGELDDRRRRELDAHLASCAECSTQLKEWRSGMAHLDEWELPVPQPVRRQWVPALQWAAAAALVLLAGFGLGRRSVSSTAEISTLKASVAELAAIVQHDRLATLSNTVNLATIAANAESMRLLDEYSRIQVNQHDADQQSFNLAMQRFDTRLARLRSEIETVAVNTESGFQQTRQNLTRLASYSVPADEPGK
jgi:anti-sigma factor RsiW